MKKIFVLPLMCARAALLTLIICAVGAVLCGCNASRYTERSVDLYRTFSPDIAYARENNTLFRDWAIISPVGGVHTHVDVNKRGDSVYTLMSGSASFPVTGPFVFFRQLPIPAKSNHIKIELTGSFVLYDNDKYNVYDDIWLTLKQLRGTRAVKCDSVRLVSAKFGETDGHAGWPEMSVNVIKTDVEEDATQMSICIAHTPTAMFNMQSCDVMVDDRDIRKYKFNNKLTLSKRKRDEFINSIDDSLKLSPVKLFAIGESLHGVDDFSINRYATIKRQVGLGACKLIMAEMHVIDGIEINQYIHGRRDLEQILSLFDVEAYVLSDDFKSFLMFLRDYNLKSDEKVHFAGVDVVYSQSGTDDEDFKNYMAENFQDGETSNFDDVWMEYCLMNQPSKNRSFDILTIRDSLMFRNAKYLIETIPGDDKMSILYGHLGHVSKSQNIALGNYCPSMGYYLDKEYGKDYYVLAQLAGAGQFPILNIIEKTMTIHNMTVPVGNSIEQLCMSTGINNFYVNNISGTSWAPDINYVRMCGQRWFLMQFYGMNIEEEFDSLVFFDSVSPLSTHNP
jgi:erythromycin esterase-like protein